MKREPSPFGAPGRPPWPKFTPVLKAEPPRKPPPPPKRASNITIARRK